MKHYFNMVTSVAAITLILTGCAATPAGTDTQMEVQHITNTEKVVALLESFNTGDPAPIAFINPNKYIQHNLAVGDGLAGFGDVMHHAPPQGFSAKVHRAFSDGEFVVTQTEYDFFGPKVGFDVFRFENGLIVEHWDNLSAIAGPNPSGRTQFDGTTTITDIELTEANKKVVAGFVDDILINGKMEKITDYISTDTYLQHNSAIADGLEGLGAAFGYFAENNMVMVFERNHKILGQGNFVLAMSEGKFGKAPGVDTSFYDLFRLENGKIVEHWDVIETIAPRDTWKNENGKF